MWSAERKLALSIKQEIFSRLEELETLFAWTCIIFSVAAQFMACRFYLPYIQGQGQISAPRAICIKLAFSLLSKQIGMNKIK